MKNLNFLFIFCASIFFFACTSDVSSEKVETPKQSAQAVPTPRHHPKNKNINKRDTFVCLQPIQKKFEERIGNEKITFDVGYFVDTIYHHSARTRILKVRDISVVETGKSNLPEKISIGLKKAIECSLQYRVFNLNDVLLKADYNFDGHLDFRFVNSFCFAQNTNFEFYLYQPDRKIFERSSALSEIGFSKFELNEKSKKLVFYNHFKASKVVRTIYTFNENGELKIVKDD